MTTGLKTPSSYYIELVTTFPPRPITNEAELIASQNRINFILDKGKLTQDDRDYLKVLGTLVYDYEEKHEPMPTLKGAALLKALIEESLGVIDTALQIVCIDSSKFENPDNPASEIYAEMVMQGCTERQNGEPETMQALKVYCQLKCQGVFLIFYEDTSGKTPQGFSPTFLSSLSKFHNARRICVVSEQPCNLQTFSPTQPNLVADIVSWIREKMMED